MDDKYSDYRCEYGCIFGDEECAECKRYRECRDYDEFSQNEDHYRDEYRECEWEE